MKKALFIILSVILAAGLAFASWEETRTEGNLWRPEGEILLYSLVRGTYSDASVEKAPSDVNVNIEIAGGSDYPYVVWRLDAHKGDLSNSILDYGEKSSATKLDGRKFAECYEAAKTIPVV